MQNQVVGNSYIGDMASAYPISFLALPLDNAMSVTNPVFRLYNGVVEGDTG